MIARDLLEWYDREKRQFAFRGTHDAYRVWVSEIMLQQTRTETAEGYYKRFIARFPDVYALANADEESVLKEWEGLGYYSRARNMKKAAEMVCAEHGGVFPDTLKEMTALPGVGSYTASAVLSIAYGLPHPAMDGNLTRVFSRLYHITDCVDERETADKLMCIAKDEMPDVRCGDFNQALMDLGATICVPGTPECERCPVCRHCLSYQHGDAEELPRKAKTAPPAVVYINVVLVFRGNTVMMVKREKSLLKNMWTYCLSENTDPDQCAEALGLRKGTLHYVDSARHMFTHRIWEMRIYEAEADEHYVPPRGYMFVTQGEMEALPMPAAMRTAKRIAVKELTGYQKE